MTPDSSCLARARSFLSALFPWRPPLRSVHVLHSGAFMCTSVSAGRRDAQKPKLEEEKKTHIWRLRLWGRGEIKQTAPTNKQTIKPVFVVVFLAMADLQTRPSTNLLQTPHFHPYFSVNDISRPPRVKSSIWGLVNHVCATGGVKERCLSSFFIKEGR